MRCIHGYFTETEGYTKGYTKVSNFILGISLMSVNLSINKNDYYCLRFRIHIKLIPFFKKSSITKSLYTKNRRLAKLKLDKIYYPYQQILNTLFIITQKQTQELVDKFIREELQQNVLTTFTVDRIRYKSLSESITLLESYERYKTWYKQQNITEKQYLVTIRKIYNMIIPYFGKETYIEEITLENIEEFREFLLTLPNINKKKYKNLSFDEIINLRDTPSEDIIKLGTHIKYLDILKQFFNYMTKSNLLKYNPCTLLNVPSNNITHREPFDNNDIQKLFNIFETLDNRKYIYYILAYTGMRPSELWKSHIITSEDNIKYFDLESRGLKLKTLSSYRVIPLHDRLIKMDIENIFEALKLKFSQSFISIYFNRTIKPKLTDNPRKIMYSFRHTVATELKRAEVNMDMVSEILGHTYENNTMTKEVYANRYTLAQLQKAINHLEL